MKSLLEKFYSLSGTIYIPKEIINDPSLILHISDTPPHLFNTIEKLIYRIKPAYIVHTGNIANNIRNVIKVNTVEDYINNAKRLVTILENSNAKEVYCVFGNHDMPDILKTLSDKIIWIDEYTNVLIEDINLRISHKPKYALSTNSDISLFGHDLGILSSKTNDHTYLNGMESVNIISINNKKITHLDYPLGSFETYKNLNHVNL